eukprot:586051-Amphidinium_carterae.1
MFFAGWFLVVLICLWGRRGWSVDVDALRASYQSSGWACFEREVANIISPPGRMLTLPAGTSAHKLLSQKDIQESN